MRLASVILAVLILIVVSYIAFAALAKKQSSRILTDTGSIPVYNKIRRV